MIFALEKIISEAIGMLNPASLGIDCSVGLDLNNFNFDNLYNTISIAPYEELVFGSSVTICLSRTIQNKNGVLIPPKVIAEVLRDLIHEEFSNLANVFVGEETFLNFHISDKYFETISLDIIKQDPSRYLSNTLNKLTTNKLQYNLCNDLENTLTARGHDHQLVHDFLKKLDNPSLAAFFYLSSDEFDIINVDYIDVLSSISKQLRNRDAIHRDYRGQTPTTFSSSLDSIVKLNSELNIFIGCLSFKLFDLIKSSKIDSFSKNISRVIMLIIDTWNDHRVRYWILKKSEYSYVKDKIIWIEELIREFEDLFTLEVENAK